MSADYMLSLGGYQFGVSAAAYQELSRAIEYRWPAQERLNRRPALQYLGIGQETIDLPGVIYPHYKGGHGQVDKLRAMAGKGKPLLLMDGLGRDLGYWCITRLEDTWSNFASNGVPAKIEFRIALSYYGEDLTS